MQTNEWIDIPSNGYRRRDLLKAFAAIAAMGILAGVPGGKVIADESPLSEDAAYKLAMEAYVYGFPLIYFARLRYSRMMEGDPITKTRHLWAQWAHRNNVVTPAIPGAPQVDTLYSNLWLDLSEEPYILTIPKMDGRYWSIQCCDLLGETYGLSNRRNLPIGGRIALVGPHWQGELPEGMDEIMRAKMPQTFNLLRMFFANAQDLPKAVEYQSGFLIAPLSAYRSGEHSVPGATANLIKPLTNQDDPLADLKTLQAMWQQCPPPVEDTAITASYTHIGLGTDNNGFEHLSPEIIKALKRAEVDARKMVLDSTRSLGGPHTTMGWTVPKPSIGYYEDGDWLYRASIAQAGTVALPISENPYHVLQKDPSGAPLTGDLRYVLRFAKDQIPQVDAFWSLHAYTSKYTVIDNPLNRYAIGDRTPGMRFEADGSLIVYVQADDPGALKRTNWLPVKTGEPFWLIVRAYEPRGLMKELRWQGPKLEKLT